MGAFRGFGKDALGFFRALKFHQDKAWFDANRAIYDEQVVAPLAALLDELTTAFARKRIPLTADSKKSIFRIHRDVRFAKDKSPYKTHAGAVMTRTGGKMEPGLLYIHVDPEGCFVAAGFYMPDSAALSRMRTAIARNKGKTFLKVAGELERAKLRFAAHGDELSRVPRGFEAFKGTPVEAPLRKKSLIVEQRLSDMDIASPKLPATIVDFTERAMPLLKFGWVALG